MSPISTFPTFRPRRLRRTDALRTMVRETTLAPSDFILPFFVTHGRGVRDEVSSMPGVHQLSVDELVKDVRALPGLGIPSVLLFGLPSEKDPVGKEAYARDGIVQQAMRAIKDACPEIIVVGDVCLCEYTDHGHCGVVENGEVLNDPTLELLAQMAAVQAEAGADIVAPSDMMDGRVGAIRAALDARGRTDVPIMAYSAKFASGFYGPFREAADSAPQFGDRRAYQMDPANGREAMREIAQDVAEGADMIMVKPALAYLDLIRRARDLVELPVVAYNVSGEYSMVKAAARNGWIDERRVTMEILTGIKRAGADLIISYHAREAAAWLSE
ncbi:MAG: porphobilinogen synthase [Chloroflexi bacterium]|nr:porphobilinogen synthase [Chloroflexota bacterium]